MGTDKKLRDLADRYCVTKGSKFKLKSISPDDTGPFSAALIEGRPVRAVFRSPGLAPEVVQPVVEAARAAGLWQGGELSLFATGLADLPL